MSFPLSNDDLFSLEQRIDDKLVNLKVELIIWIVCVKVAETALLCAMLISSC